MSGKYPHLEHVIAMAVTDKTFRGRLLNGDRCRVLDGFDLAQEEREAILAIKAETLETFAQELLHWMQRRDAPDSVRPEAVGPILACDDHFAYTRSKC